jgi:hypothetical protein
MTKKEVRIVCAAIRAEDGELLLGIRHYSKDMIVNITNRKDGEKFKRRGDKDQGFVDQWGVFFSREEAYQIAKNNGQIIYPEVCHRERLYSEGLY